MFIIVPLDANKVNCAIVLVKKKRRRIGQFDLSSLWANTSGTVNPWADSTVVLRAKVNCLSPMGDS